MPQVPFETKRSVRMSVKFQSFGSFNLLHPTCEAMLTVPYPDPWTVSVGEQRRQFQRRLRDISGPIPAIRSIETIVTRAEGAQVPVTLYRPRLEGTLPLALFIHGGGFVIGDHDQYHALCARVANDVGCIVASIGYGLAPETPFPKPVDDCKHAYEWLLKDHEWLGFDPAKVALFGDSAGGNLCAALGVLATQGVIAQPQGMWLIYPVMDFAAKTPSRDLFAKGYGLNQDLMTWFGEQYLTDADAAKQVLASPGRMSEQTATAFPPSLIQTAGFDPLKDEAKDFAHLLDAKGRLLHYTCYEEMTHGFIHAYDLLDEAQMATDEGVLWLRRLFQV